MRGDSRKRCHHASCAGAAGNVHESCFRYTNYQKSSIGIIWQMR
jgi:hypothetical protein